MAWTVLRTVTDSVSYVTAADHNETKANFDILGGTDGATKTGNWYVTGNVGIGTSTPYATLHLHNTVTSGESIIKFTNNNGTVASGSTSTDGLNIGFDSTGNATIWNYEGSSIVFGTSASERMRITTAGYVGIGTGTPTSTLSVNGGINLTQTYSTYLVNSYYDTSWKYIGNGPAWGIGNNFGGPANAVTIATAAANASGAGAALTWTPTFNILNNGYVGIGTTSPVAPLDVAGTSNFVAASGGTFMLIDSLSGQTAQIIFKNLNNNRWWINSNNDTRLYILDANANDGVYIAQNATSWTSNSDSRLKDVKEIIANALDKVNQLTGVKFTWKRDADNPDAKTRIGLIAQDVLSVLPEAVDDETPDIITNEETGKISGGLGVRYTELIPLLVNAIKELAQRVEALEA